LRIARKKVDLRTHNKGSRQRAFFPKRPVRGEPFGEGGARFGEISA
jgi:hypothetical protein